MKRDDFFKMIIDSIRTPKELREYAEWLMERDCHLFARWTYERLLDTEPYRSSKAHRWFIEDTMKSLRDNINHFTINYLEFFKEKEGFSPCVTRVVCNFGSEEVRGILNRLWSRSFRKGVSSQKLSADIPQPVIYGDELIVPYTDDTGRFCEFVSLSPDKGEERWRWTPGGDLTFSSTPILFHGFIYSFNNDGLKVKNIKGSYEESYEGLGVTTEEFMLPLLVRYKKKIVNYSGEEKKVEVCHLVLSSLRKIFILNLPHGEIKEVIEVIDGNKDRIVGIERDEKGVVILTQKGTISILDLENLSIRKVKTLQNSRVVSPPWRNEGYIYFEYMREDGTRVVGALRTPVKDEKEVKTKILKNESGCIDSHTHWKYPLLPGYQDKRNNQNWILIHSHLLRNQTGFIYKIRRAGNNLVVAPQRLLEGGSLHLFNAGVYGDFLVYGEGRNASSVDLRNGTKRGNLRLNADIIAEPIFYKDLIFFITTDGIECVGIN